MPTKRRTTSSTRPPADGPASGGGAPWEPIFRNPGDDVVPGELLITLSPTAAREMTESVPLHPAGPMGSAATRLGVPEVDAVLADLGAADVVRLALPSGGIAAGSAGRRPGLLESDADEPLGRSFRVRVARGDDVADAAERLRALDAVEVAEPNRYRETLAVPDDPRYPQQWGLPKINAPAAWDRTTGDPSVVVAVVDSGADLDHPDLVSLLVPGQDLVDLGPSPVPPAGFRFEGDFSGRDPVPEDEVGHGTHVAGTIAALSDNAAGVAGVTWTCRIMPVKALTRIVRISDGQVRGVGSSADVAAAVRWAADHGASVINMSLGSPSPTTVERNAVAYAVGKGCVVVAAMGNDGSSDPSYPAAYPDVVSVGAIDSADKRASFSQTGSHIDVVAPGVGIWSTYPDDGYASLSGTSMACPHVAGVAALVRSVKPAATVAEVADILRTTARPLRDDPSDPVPNDAYGTGCVDARAAVDKASPVIGPPLLRTPVLPCPPVSLLIDQCGPIKTLFGTQCPPLKTVRIPCWPRSPICGITTLPPTPTPTPTPTFVPRPGAAAGQRTGTQGGYDPYGLMGYGTGGYATGGYGAATGATGQQATGADQPEAAGYQAGYAAGYAAAMAEAQGPAGGAGDAQVRSPFPACEPFSVDPLGCKFPLPPTVEPAKCFPSIDCPPSVPVWFCPDPATTRWDCPTQTVHDPWCPAVLDPGFQGAGGGPVGQGPGNVINPNLPPHLRTPLIACPPLTLPVLACPTLPTTLQPWQCPPLTLRPWQCPPLTLQPWQCPPPRTIVEPWCQLVPTQTIDRPPTFPPVPGPGGGEGMVQAQGPGNVFDPNRPVHQLRTPLIACWPRTVVVNECWVPRTTFRTGCWPRTVFEPECIPIPTPTVNITPTTPQTPQPGGFGRGGYGQAGYGDPYGYGGYDPYGRSPFGG